MQGRARKILVASIAWAVIALAARPARAEGGPFGLGLIIGSPTGLSAKLYLNRRNALDFALGFNFLNGRGLHFHMDYLWHPVMLAEDEAFFLPLYLGVGGRLLNHERANADNQLHVGVRVPVGILFDFKRVPLDVFFEIALVADFINGTDEGVLTLDAGIGARFYF